VTTDTKGHTDQQIKIELSVDILIINKPGLGRNTEHLLHTDTIRDSHTLAALGGLAHHHTIPALAPGSPRGLALARARPYLERHSDRRTARRPVSGRYTCWDTLTADTPQPQPAVHDSHAQPLRVCGLVIAQLGSGSSRSPASYDLEEGQCTRTYGEARGLLPKLPASPVTAGQRLGRADSASHLRQPCPSAAPATPPTRTPTSRRCLPPAVQATRGHAHRRNSQTPTSLVQWAGRLLRRNGHEQHAT
jgi:hypothetical protein